MRFRKLHGLGNDFVVLEALDAEAPIDGALAVRMCDRHRGIGADGVLSILRSRVPGADARMHVWNADGSVAEMCGNGLRCVLRVLGGTRRIDTDAGVLEGVCLDDGRVRVELGPVRVDDDDLELDTPDGPVRGRRITTGNPHFVLRPSDAPILDRARRLGAGLEHDPAFPRRTNVEFVAVRDGGLDVVVHERGVGITQACGTGAAASVAAARAWGLVPSGPVEVRLPGGPLVVDWAGEIVRLTGEAVTVYEGEWT